MLKQFFATLLAANLFVFNFASILPCLAQYNQPTQYGMNVEPSVYFASDGMFVDVLMRATGWWTNPPTNVPLTPQGYPASGSATSLFYMDGYPSGNYQFYGEGDFRFNPRGGNIVPGSLQKNGNVTTALITFNVVPPNNGGYYGSTNQTVVLFDVWVNDPNNPPNNFHLIRPDYPAWPNTNAEFGKQFLQSLAPFQCIRVMDWMGTNGSTVTTWASRTDPVFFGDDHRGLAYERFIELANATKCDLWINIPHMATDDWIENMAQLLADRLDPSLHVYYEYSNECWNWGFPQWQQIETWAWANPALTAQGAWERHGQEVAFQLMRCVKIMQPKLGARGRPLLEGQLGGVSYTAGAGLDWINKTYGPPSNYIFGIGGAAYFSLSSADPSPATLDDVFTSMTDNINSEIATEVKQYTTLAQHYNLQCCYYEAGQSLYAYDQNSFAFYQSAQYDPRMATAYQQLAKVLQSNGSYLCCFFHNIGHDSRYGYWGALTDLNYLNSGGSVKYNAEAAIANAGGLADGKKPPPPGSNPPPPGNSPPGGNSPGKPGRGTRPNPWNHHGKSAKQRRCWPPPNGHPGKTMPPVPGKSGR